MSRPVMTVKSSASRNISVDGDPNWDDQKLIINGHVVKGTYTLVPEATITVSVNWEGPPEEGMIGVMFGAGVGLYELSVGQDPQTGNLAVTDGYPLDGPVNLNYAVSDQTPWTMRMDFMDAP
jgi:hypothetical protein